MNCPDCPTDLARYGYFVPPTAQEEMKALLDVLNTEPEPDELPEQLYLDALDNPGFRARYPLDDGEVLEVEFV